MEIKQICLQSHFDQRKLVGSFYHSENSEALLVLVHGMCEHRLRYHDFMSYLTNQNISCLLFDTRGHGESIHSVEELGYFNDANNHAIFSDLDQIIDFATTLLDNKPIYLFGHSMGSLIVRTYFKTYGTKVHGLIVCGSPSYNPLLPIAKSLNKSLQTIYGSKHRSALMQKLLFGTYAKQFTNTISENAWISRDKNIVADYDSDPLCGFTFTCNGFDNLFSLLHSTYHAPIHPAIDLNTPIFFIAGSKDPVIISKKHFVKAVNHFKSFGFNNISYKLYDNARHELLNELNKDEVYKDILLFLHQCITGQSQ